MLEIATFESVVSFLTCIAIFLIGWILTEPYKLQHYLGITSPPEHQKKVAQIASLIKLIGKILMVIGCVKALSAIGSLIILFS